MDQVLRAFLFYFLCSSVAVFAFAYVASNQILPDWLTIAMVVIYGAWAAWYFLYRDKNYEK